MRLYTIGCRLGYRLKCEEMRFESHRKPIMATQTRLAHEKGFDSV